MKNAVFFLVAVLLAVGLADENPTDEVMNELIVVFEQEANENPHADVELFKYYYSFCVPILGPFSGEFSDFSASLMIDFLKETNEDFVDFDFGGRSFNSVENNSQTGGITLEVNFEDLDEWFTEKGFPKPFSGKIYSLTPVGRVALSSNATWIEAFQENLICEPVPEEGNDDDSYPIYIGSIYLSPIPTLIICASFLMLSVLSCCFRCSTVEIIDEEDVIPEYQQFFASQHGESEQPQEFNHHNLIARNVEEMDEDEIIRRVQEQSRIEYESQNNFSVVAQREALSQYMQPPIMTPEAYANFLSSQYDRQ